jgi:hypothetical protein
MPKWDESLTRTKHKKYPPGEMRRRFVYGVITGWVSLAAMAFVLALLTAPR